MKGKLLKNILDTLYMLILYQWGLGPSGYKKQHKKGSYDLCIIFRFSTMVYVRHRWKSKRDFVRNHYSLKVGLYKEIILKSWIFLMNQRENQFNKIFTNSHTGSGV